MVSNPNPRDQRVPFLVQYWTSQPIYGSFGLRVVKQKTFAAESFSERKGLLSHVLARKRPAPGTYLLNHQRLS